jgi:formylglycine-generating enzyme required for sulfatase activity
MAGVSWFDAAAYCNWLSRKEGLTECYETNEGGKYGNGMKIKSDLGGYRLPTEAEWEYACRAGAGTLRYYGASVDLLGQYAWYYNTSKMHAWSSGSLMPNEFGLFDMLGNMWEWCNDIYDIYQPLGKTTTDNTNIRKTVYLTYRLLRGGSFSDLPEFVRSAYRDKWYAPALHDSPFNGFRPSRTLP